MKRLFATAATVALATSMLLTPAVAAGGAATVSVVGPSTSPIAGVPWLLELEVLQHGITPIDWELVSLFARQPASGMVTAANGRPDGAVGRYVMDVTFPDAGDWTLEFGLRELLVMPAETTMVTVSASAADGNQGASVVQGVEPDCV
jgi:hypothetical protein